MRCVRGRASGVGATGWGDAEAGEAETHRFSCGLRGGVWVLQVLRLDLG